MGSIGRRRGAIAEGYIPEGSTGPEETTRTRRTEAHVHRAVSCLEVGFDHQTQVAPTNACSVESFVNSGSPLSSAVATMTRSA